MKQVLMLLVALAGCRREKTVEVMRVREIDSKEAKLHLDVDGEAGRLRVTVTLPRDPSGLCRTLADDVTVAVNDERLQITSRGGPDGPDKCKPLSAERPLPEIVTEESAYVTVSDSTGKRHATFRSALANRKLEIPRAVKPDIGYTSYRIGDRITIPWPVYTDVLTRPGQKENRGAPLDVVIRRGDGAIKRLQLTRGVREYSFVIPDDPFFTTGSYHAVVDAEIWHAASRTVYHADPPPDEFRGASVRIRPMGWAPFRFER